MRRLIKPFLFSLFAILLASVAFASSAVEKEVSTAVSHAEFATNAKKVSGIHLHLHHVVNCLVGESGKQFDSSAGDPCKGMGNGAINDAGTPALKSRLEKVLMDAEKGLSESSYKEAHHAASRVKRMLRYTLSKMSK